MARLKIENLGKSFSGKIILEDISFATDDGELLVVLGPSGCGKSTLLRLIAGLESPDRGEIYIGDRRVDTLLPQKRNVALVFQNYALYPHMTVAQNLAFPLKIGGFNRREIKEKVSATAEMIGLGDRLKARPAELSGGQRQRVALGRAIIRHPELYLLDEPLSNLDAELRARMRRELVELQKRLGTTTVYVTHDQVEALTMADRLVVLESGKIRQIGSADEIYNQPDDIFVASFLGTPRINLLELSTDELAAGPIALPAGRLPANYPEKKVIAGIRPEDIMIESDGKFSGIMNGVEYLGDRSIATISFGEHILTAITRPPIPPAGTSLKFNIAESRILYFNPKTTRRLKLD